MIGFIVAGQRQYYERSQLEKKELMRWLGYIGGWMS